MPKSRFGGRRSYARTEAVHAQKRASRLSGGDVGEAKREASIETETRNGRQGRAC